MKRDMACAGGQLHGIPRMVKFLSQSSQCHKGKLAPGHSRLELMFEVAPSGSVLYSMKWPCTWAALICLETASACSANRWAAAGGCSG